MSTAYATVSDVEAGFRTLTSDEKTKCEALLTEAAVVIDAYHTEASEDAKKVVSCRIVRRVIGDGNDMVSYPMGASQGSMSALGYTQTWAIGSGSSGEIYLNRTDKHLLGVGNRIGSYSPVEELT